jgi:hypothetical protein
MTATCRSCQLPTDTPPTSQFVCRRPYCVELATDDLRQLCEFHGSWQPKRLKHDARVEAKQDRERRAKELLTPPSWATEAACREHPEVDFFPSSELRPTAAERAARIAKAICTGCPVWRECLEAGLEERFGIWGGLAPWERGTATRARRGSAA